MSKGVIIMLAAVNVALLLALILQPGVNPSPAGAQDARTGTDYMVVTGKVSANDDAVYVLDLGKRRLRAWQMDKTKKVLVPFDGRDLSRDFPAASIR
jgi:hypothetical protein